jgi:hypothetical protein
MRSPMAGMYVGGDGAVDGVEHGDGGEAVRGARLGLVGGRPLDDVGGPVGGVGDEAVEPEGACFLAVAVHGLQEDVAGGADDDVVELDGADRFRSVGLGVGDGDGVALVEGFDEAGEGLGGGFVRRVPHRVPLVRFLVVPMLAYLVGLSQ